MFTLIINFASKNSFAATAILTALIEIATMAARFGLGLKSSTDTAFVKHLTFGLRIHHGYVGLLLVAAGGLFGERLARLARIIGWAMFLSDVIHHFIVLKIATGSPQFDIFYQ